MPNDQIPFNYFYELLKQINRKKIKEYYEKESEYDEELWKYFDIYNTPTIKNEKRIQFLEESLFEICTIYIPLANSKMMIYPNNPYEFIDWILKSMEKNPYRKSFLQSIQFIYQDFFETLEKGRPMLFSSKDSLQEKKFQITLDSCYQITEFESINLNLIEQALIMNKLVLQMKKEELGPVPYVRMRYRKDI